MTVTIVAGFAFQFAMGRSTFAAPLLVHAHAVTFMGWTFFYLLQNTLVFTGNVALHRRIGWIGVGWVSAMVLLGIAITARIVRDGHAPPFFTPLYFLTMNTLSVIAFAGLFAAAIAMRRRSDWHRRLMACAMAGLTGPAFGRLLPGPLLIPWAAWAIFAGMMLFPLAGVIHDQRSAGRIHPAWAWGIGVLVADQLLMGLVSATGMALSLYGALVAGGAGAKLAPLVYPPFP
ncbi:hypothetical protein F9288_07550 [Sphingomonas sp. CL5.1]|nr:hypothetical protein F9288_07550 [Sphingomonas sp. CL5.1]